MNLLDRIVDMTGSASLSTSVADVWGTWAGLLRSSSGQMVSPESSLRVSAVLACVRILSETLASFPLKVYRRLPDGGKEVARDHILYSVLHDQPNKWMTSFEFRETMQAYLSLRGNAYAIIALGEPWEPVQLLPVRPDRVTVERLSNGSLRYTVRWLEGAPTILTQREILHIRGLSLDGITGISLVAAARDGIGLAMAAETHGAATFKNGARLGMVMETDQPLTKDQLDDVIAKWRASYAGAENSGKVGLLPFGIKAKELGLSNVDAQYLEIRKFQVSDIARVFRIPPHMIGDLEKATFSNIEQQGLEFLQYTMRPWLARWEQAIQRDLIIDDEYFAEFLVDDLLRADAAARGEYYTKMLGSGIMSINEVRAKENMNRIGPDGDKRFIQLNMTTIDKAGEEQPAKQPSAPLAESKQEKMAAIEQAKKLLSATMRRMIQLEISGVVKAAKKPNAAKELDSFYAGYSYRFLEAMNCPVKMLAIVSGQSIDGGAIVEQHLDRSKSQLVKILAEVGDADLSDAIADCVDEWHSRAAQTVESILVGENHE